MGRNPISGTTIYYTESRTKNPAAAPTRTYYTQAEVSNLVDKLKDVPVKDTYKYSAREKNNSALKRVYDRVKIWYNVVK